MLFQQRFNVVFSYLN